MAMVELLPETAPADRSLLIVEDDKSFLHRLSRAMEGRGFAVITAESVAEGRSCLLFGFAAWRPGEFQSCLVTHERSGSTVRAVTINRLATPGGRVAEEIETAILRQLVADV